jgi:hypothetical protein
MLRSVLDLADKAAENPKLMTAASFELIKNKQSYLTLFKIIKETSTAEVE